MVRLQAHRLMNIDFTRQPSFDIYRDKKLCEYLSDKFQFFFMLDDDGVGFGVLPVEALKSALLNVTMRKDVEEAVKKDIEHGNQCSGWVRYVFYYDD